jgi:hypothetical protein
VIFAISKEQPHALGAGGRGLPRRALRVCRPDRGAAAHRGLRRLAEAARLPPSAMTAPAPAIRCAKRAMDPTLAQLY